MALITDITVKAFDVTAIHVGDAIRIKRAGDTTCRNGLVTKMNEGSMTVLYISTANHAASFLEIAAADAAAGLWELFWTIDFVSVHHSTENGGGANG